MNRFIQSINKVNESGEALNSDCGTTCKRTNLNNDSTPNIKVPMSKYLVAAAGFNVEAPIMNAIIGNITGTLPTKRNELNEVIKCTVCDCEITSKVIWTHHLNGSRHKKRLKALDIITQLKEEKGIQVDSCESPNSFRCHVCCLVVNSAQQLEFHLLGIILQGAKHKKNVAKINSPEAELKTVSESPDETKFVPPIKKKKQEPKTFTCVICNIVMNSQCQYDQHLTAKKHKLRSLKANIRDRSWKPSTCDLQKLGSNKDLRIGSASKTILWNLNGVRSKNHGFYNCNNTHVIGF